MREGRRKPIGPVVSMALVLMLAAWAAVPGAPAESSAEDGEASAPRVHADPAELTRAFLEALDALLAEEPKRAKLALDRVAEVSPSLMPEDENHLGGAVVGADSAFHKLLDLAREVANRGDNALAFRYHQGLQRTCIQCHDFARTDGVFVVSPGD